MDPSTGIISGTPSADSPQANYIVTGSNSGGSIQAAVSPTITVNPVPNILLEAEPQTAPNTLQFVNSSILSEDILGLWVLRDYTSGAILAGGDAGLGTAAGLTSVAPAQMAGPTLAIGVVGGIQLLSSASGQPLGTIASPGWAIEANTTTLAENDFLATSLRRKLHRRRDANRDVCLLAHWATALHA
jgi:hypothetical protein